MIEGIHPKFFHYANNVCMQSGHYLYYNRLCLRTIKLISEVVYERNG